MLNYFTKIIRITNHPVSILYREFYNYDFYSRRPYALPVVGRAKVLLEESTIPVNNIECINIIDLHYIGTPTTRYNLSSNKRNYSDNQL